MSVTIASTDTEISLQNKQIAEFLANNIGSGSATSEAPAASPVTVDTTVGGTVIAAANTSRKYIVLQNNGTIACIVRLGGDPTNAAYNFVLAPATAARDGKGGSITIDLYQGAIKGLTESSSTIISVTEVVDA